MKVTIILKQCVPTTYSVLFFYKNNNNNNMAFYILLELIFKTYFVCKEIDKLYI